MQIVDPNSEITEGFGPGIMPQDYGEQLSEDGSREPRRVPGRRSRRLALRRAPGSAAEERQLDDEGRAAVVSALVPQPPVHPLHELA